MGRGSLGAGKNKLNFLWSKTAVWDPLFDPPNPQNSLCGSLFCVLSQEMRHINFFLGVQNGVFWVGAKKFMLENFMCFSVPIFLSTINFFTVFTRGPANLSEKTKGQQLEGKIVSALFHAYWHFSRHFSHFSEFFRLVPPGFFSLN